MDSMAVEEGEARGERTAGGGDGEDEDDGDGGSGDGGDGGDGGEGRARVGHREVGNGAVDVDDDDSFLNVPTNKALEEQEKREHFDEVLKKPLSYWLAVKDKGELKETLKILLRGLRSSVPEPSDDLAERPAAKKLVGEAVTLSTTSGISYESFVAPADDQQYEERAKHIPIRMSDWERSLLAIVEAALDVSEYTEKVDVLMYSKTKIRDTISGQIREFLSIVTGLLIAADVTKGSKILTSGDFQDHAELFQMVFEVARRHKIANPKKLRTDYGKLIHLLQDAQTPEMVEELGFSLVQPLVTVYSYLEARSALELLRDPKLELATRDVSSLRKDRKLVEWELEQKTQARKDIVARWTTAHPDSDSLPLEEREVYTVLESIGDSNSYLREVRDPCDEMIGYLKKAFDRNTRPSKEESLAISNGRGGARLTHTHAQQFDYVLQSLTLWREVVSDMFKLWFMAETDLLNPNSPYRLRNTGQGLNRVQQAPNVSNTMTEILKRVKGKVRSWVGSWVVHTNDDNVPNALTFIDKYNQVARILVPIVSTMRRLETLAVENEQVAGYVKECFGGVKVAQRIILRDFFRHAFDGSGANNYFDAGSCVDGRLTSAWNWCSCIEKKSYFTLFLLCGFTGFDGRF